MTNRLRVARAERRVNQRACAAVIGSGLDRYWRIENEYAEPTKDEQKALAKFLGKSVSDLFPIQSEQAAPA